MGTNADELHRIPGTGRSVTPGWRTEIQNFPWLIDLWVSTGEDQTLGGEFVNVQLDLSSWPLPEAAGGDRPAR